MSHPAVRAMSGAVVPHRVRLMEHVQRLAGPEMRGRMPGDVGYQRASLYVEACFRGLDLEPLGQEGGFRQPFELETNRVLSSRLRLRRDGERPWELSLGEDYVLRGLTGGGRVKGPLVFLGHARQERVDELAGVELEGRIAVVFKFPPPWDDRAIPPLPRERARELHHLGIRGMLLVPNPLHDRPDRLGASLVERGEPLPGVPLAVLAESAGQRLLPPGTETLAGLQWALEREEQAVSRPLPGCLTMQVETEGNPRGESWNVLGLLRGADGDRAREAVLLGAHLDHVGIQGESLIFPGAQDNASGVAALLEVATALRAGPPPRRSVIFAVFGAEEAGILGSRAYAADPPWPLERTVAMLNADCVGAGDGLNSRGRKDHPELFELHDRLNEQHVGLENPQVELPAGGADAQPFQEAGVPNLYIVTRRAYRHLHMAQDRPETLNPPLFEGVARLLHRLAAKLAEVPGI